MKSVPNPISNWTTESIPAHSAALEFGPGAEVALQVDLQVVGVAEDLLAHDAAEHRALAH